MSTSDGAGVIMFIADVCFVAGAIFDAWITDRNWRDEAVKKGKAEYYLDKDNKRRWRWKP